jgi:phospholipid/cholesterol/gamma-HCH transport system substrate-binding protein
VTVLVAVAWIVLGGGGQRYEVRALVENAGQLVKGNLVKVGGVTVGSVAAIDLTSDNQAQITLRISDPRFKPLHEGTIATIRNTSLSSVAGRQVALQPGPNSNPAIEDGGAIKAEDTRPIVDLDQLLNTLDAQARTALQDLVHGGAVAFGSHPQQADAALAALNPAVAQARLTTSELAGDQATFERALVESAGVVSSVASRAGDLQAGIANGARVANAVTAESASLDAALRRAPPALKRSNTTLAELRSGWRTSSGWRSRSSTRPRRSCARSGRSCRTSQRSCSACRSSTPRRAPRSPARSARCRAPPRSCRRRAPTRRT